MKLQTIILAGAIGIGVLHTEIPASATVTQEVCTVGGVAVPEGQSAPADIPLVVSCFSSLIAAEEFIKAGAPGDLEQLAPQARGEVAPMSTVIIGRQYTAVSRGGSVLVQWGTGSGCYGTTYGFPSMPTGWNDVIRSTEGFNNCWVSDYTSTSYGGSVLNCTPYCSSMGSFATLTSSVVYRPSGTFG